MSILSTTSRTFRPAAVAAAAALTLSACGRGPENAACNRQCLLDATDAYVAALVAHDIARAPLSDEIVFVENATRMKPGEGLWKSVVKGPSTFVVHVPDEVNQSAGYLAMMTFMGPPQAPQGASPEQRAALAKAPAVEQPVIVAMRLKFDPRGRIVEAEHARHHEKR